MADKEEVLRTESVKGNKTNICSGCRKEIPECKPEFLIFGDGIGNDNVVGCDIFKAIKKKQKWWNFWNRISVKKYPPEGQ